MATPGRTWKPADGFITIPVALELVTGVIEPTTTVALAEVLRVVILNRFLHLWLSLSLIFIATDLSRRIHEWG